jgi:hypothetical protein
VPPNSVQPLTLSMKHERRKPREARTSKVTHQRSRSRLSGEMPQGSYRLKVRSALVGQRLPMGPLGRITSYSSNGGLRSEIIRNHAGTNRYAASACAEPLLTAADRP